MFSRDIADMGGSFGNSQRMECGPRIHGRKHSLRIAPNNYIANCRDTSREDTSQHIPARCRYTATMNLKIQNASLLKGDKLTKLSGLLSADMLVRMMDEVSLKPNPRSPNVNKITRAIDETLEQEPELLQYKTKGILMAGEYRGRDGETFVIDFQKPVYGGILDGGHNFFALVRTLLIEAVKVLYPTMGATDKRKRKEAKKVRSWRDLVDIWQLEGAKVGAFVAEATGHGGDKKAGVKLHRKLSFLVPVEVLSPSEGIPAKAVGEIIHSISVARNNNVQLKDVAIAQHKGSYDYLKHVLPDGLNRKIQWKSGENQCPILPTKIVSLAILPIEKLAQAGVFREIETAVQATLQTDGDGTDTFHLPAVHRKSIYTSTAGCVSAYSQLVDAVSNLADNGADDDDLKQTVVDSLAVVAEMPDVWDALEERFEDLFGAVSGAVGKQYPELPCNKKGPTKKEVPTRFQTRQIQPGRFPACTGFLAPLFAALVGGSLVFDKEGRRVVWSIHPSILVKELDAPSSEFLVMLEDYVRLMDSQAGYDPSKFGKTQAVYDMFEHYQSVQLWFAHARETAKHNHT